jgi:hypothetical protein
MKKGIMFMLPAVVFSAMTLVGCGEKFTPMTEEQINTKVDSLFEAQKDAKLEELRAACQSGATAQATAKFEAMKEEAVAKK